MTDIKQYGFYQWPDLETPLFTVIRFSHKHVPMKYHRRNKKILRLGLMKHYGDFIEFSIGAMVMAHVAGHLSAPYLFKIKVEIKNSGKKYFYINETFYMREIEIQ